MAGVCTVCRHDDVLALNQDLANGASTRVVAMRYKVGHHSVARHKRDHLFTGELPLAMPLLTMYDIVNIPVQMRERAELLMLMLDDALEPFMRTTDRKASPAGVRGAQMNVILAILKMQQTDEQTILKLTGLMREDSDVKRADLVVTEQWKVLADTLDRRLYDIAGGDHEKATQHQQDLAKMLLGQRDPTISDPDGHVAYQGWGQPQQDGEQPQSPGSDGSDGATGDS